MAVVSDTLPLIDGDIATVAAGKDSIFFIFFLPLFKTGGVVRGKELLLAPDGVLGSTKKPKSSKISPVDFERLCRPWELLCPISGSDNFRTFISGVSEPRGVKKLFKMVLRVRSMSEEHFFRSKLVLLSKGSKWNNPHFSTGCPRKINTIKVAFSYNRGRSKIKKSLMENKLSVLPTQIL